MIAFTTTSSSKILSEAESRNRWQDRFERLLPDMVRHARYCVRNEDLAELGPGLACELERLASGTSRTNRIAAWRAVSYSNSAAHPDLPR
jgi:hypothetical protein